VRESMTGKDIVSAGVQLPTTSDSKGFKLDVAGIPIPLKRTFAALDRLVALPVEALGDYVEKKLKGNVDSHVEAVQKKRRKKGKKENVENPSVKTTKRIASWAESASEVDPEEKDFSALWRALLNEILDEKDDAEDLMAIVKNARASDIRYFLECYAKNHPEHGFRSARKILEIFKFGKDEEISDRLKANGLVRRTFSNSLLVTTLILTLTPVVLAIGSGFLNSARWDSAKVPALEIVLGYMFITLIGISALAFNLKRPTELGKRLCDLYNQYVDDRD
jgi:hypothetical protein